MKALPAGPKVTRSFHRFFLVVLFLELIYVVAEPALGRQLAGADLVRLVFIVSLIVLLIGSLPWIKRWMLWRVRNRLLVTYFLVGVVPMVLILDEEGWTRHQVKAAQHPLKPRTGVVVSLLD